MTTTMAVCLNVSLYGNASGGAGEMAAGGAGEGEVDEYSRRLAQQVEHYVMKRGIPVISALGLLGNFLALLVLTKEKLHKSLTKMEISAHIGLIALAVSDLLFCLLVLLVTTLPFQETYRAGELLVYFHLVSGGLITVFIVTSTWLIVVMAAERYVAVCHPLRARNLITLCRTRAYVILLFLLCPLCTVPVFMESFIQAVTCTDGRVLYRVDKVSRDSVVVRRIVWAMCFDFLPCAALIYFNTCLIWKIHKAKQLREKMAPHQSSKPRSSSSPTSSARLHANSTTVRKFRWDGSNTKSLHPNRCSGGGGGGGGGGGKGLVASLRQKGMQDAHAQDLLESSESNDQSHSNANSVGGRSGVELRREMHQLLCQQGSNGVVKTSPRLSPSPPSHQNRSGSSRCLLMSGLACPSFLPPCLPSSLSPSLLSFVPSSLPPFLPSSLPSFLPSFRRLV